MITGLVSVVIPFYSGGNWLTEAVESAITQTYENIEIIVINDGSPEDLSKFIEKYEKRITYIYQHNKGAAAARNVGIDLSNGEYIAFLDADDVWMPNKLEIQISSMIETGAYWSHTSYSTFGLHEKSKNVNVSNYQGDIFPLSIISNPIATPSVVVKTSIFRKNSNFRFEEDMKYGEDTILWLRLSMEYPLLAVDQPLVKVRMRGSNAATRASSQIKARADIWNTIKKKKLFNINLSLSILARFAYSYCTLLYKLLKVIGETPLNKLTEIISKFLYIIPWTIFKIEKSIINIRNR